ncbi:MAG: NTP transferase domain-containing protein [candidate division Zixibacteria bacterium]|nr:NTP transferase domain-containing protein [candidate division Zixibacteria bacterium]
MKVVILAGGLGRRLIPSTVVLPKPLMPVGNYPILEILIRTLKKHRLTDITLAVGHLGNLIETYFGKGEKLGVRISYNHEKKPLGTVGALSQIRGLDKTFMVMNGDLLTRLNFSKLISFHKKSGASTTIATQMRKAKIDFGVIESKRRDQVTDYIEKPEMSYQVSMGVYMFEPSALKFIPRGKRLDFPELVKKLLKHKKKVAIYPCREFWLDIGRPEDYARAVEVFPKIRKQLWNKNTSGGK